MLQRSHARIFMYNLRNSNALRDTNVIVISLLRVSTSREKRISNASADDVPIQAHTHIHTQSRVHGGTQLLQKYAVLLVRAISLRAASKEAALTLLR